MELPDNDNGAKQMHPDDLKDEADLAAMKTSVLAAVSIDAKTTMKVYALLEAASATCDAAHDQFLEEAFNEVFNRRGDCC